MKKIFKYIVLSATLAANSCTTDLDEININPNDEASVDPKVLLPTIATRIFTVNSDNHFASRMLVATDGEDNYQYYKWSDESFSPYSSLLLNITKMMEEAEKSGNKNYIAIGKTYRAIVFHDLTRMFGDIPYSEAVKGEQGITKPKYDTQEEVFAGILKELKEANELINSSDKIEGDIIYGGDASKWKKFINAYRLKVLISLTKKSSVGGINVASEFASIANSQPLMSSNSDNGQLKFFNAADSRYPSFNSSSYGSSTYMADFFINMFKDRKDPRLFIFAEQTAGAQEQGKPVTDFTSYNGGNPILPYSSNNALVGAKNISKINVRYYKDPINEPVNVLSYSEQQFILAEAAARGWIGNGKEHYEKAITANFDFYKAHVKNIDTYFAGFNLQNYLNSPMVNYDAASSTNDRIKLIITQKYMTMFHQSQMTAYFDYLRTGSPDFPIPPSVPHAPYRFTYPRSEYNYNEENVKAAVQRQFNGKDGIMQITWWLK